MILFHRYSGMCTNRCNNYKYSNPNSFFVMFHTDFYNVDMFTLLSVC